LFTYNRSNIWPIQDIGLLRGISKNYKKKYLPPESYVKLLKKNLLHIVRLRPGIYGEA
jgi:DNA-3-methyladenine glycosylase II